MKVALIINGSYRLTFDSVSEAVADCIDRYKNTFWQQYPDTIEVRDIVEEPNGFIHVGNKILLQSNSSKFWTK